MTDINTLKDTVKNHKKVCFFCFDDGFVSATLQILPVYGATADVMWC